MRQNYSQRLEMQIPKQPAYIGTSILKDFDYEFDKLSKNYAITNKDRVKSFIKKQDNILEYIHELTPLLNEYFPKHEKFIEFCEDPEFNDLDFIMIYIKCSIYEKDKKILEAFKNEALYKSKFSRNIRGLVCVELW